MSNFLALMIYLLYYCGFYASLEMTPPVEQPTGQPSSDEPQPVDVVMDKVGEGIIRVHIDGDIKFHFKLPECYDLRNDAIVKKDVCQGIPDGSKVPATGRELYEYVQKKNLVIGSPTSAPLQQQIHRVLQRGQIFYFECKNGGIDSLHACQEGSVLLGDSCIPVDGCLDRDHAATFTDQVLGSDHFYQCLEQQKKEHKKCPPGTFFIHDSCRRPKSLDAMCGSSSSFFPLDNTSYIRCDEHGVAHKYNCPPGHVLIGQKCEVNWCLGKPEGARVGLPEETFQDLFAFSPGYAVCDKIGRVSDRVSCLGEEVQQQSSEEEDLSQLPMVFDQKIGGCARPSLCDNVWPLDPHKTVVPSREYSCRLGSTWKFAKMFDESVGYVCDGGQKKRIPLTDGNRVKNFRIENACDQNPSFIVIGDATDRYYDCFKPGVEFCQPDQFFNGESCERKQEHMHQYRGLDIFKMSNLEDDWIAPWNYSNDPSPFKSPPNQLVCTAPESEYVHGYNVCSHPDCSVFGFLKQLETFVLLPDGHICMHYDGKLVKSREPVLASGYQFWNQRGRLRKQGEQTTHEPADHDPCVFGQHIETGHFVFDSVLYATCDTAQPFVFCPSASTNGIVEIDGPGGKVYACAPQSPGFGRMTAGATRVFSKHQLQRVVNSSPQKAVLMIDDKSLVELEPGEKYDVPAADRVKITTDTDVILEYKYTQTYPPNAYYEGSTAKAGTTTKESFLMKAEDMSNKPMDILKHKVHDHIHGFKMW